MDVIIILIMGIAGSKGCIFACPPPKKDLLWEVYSAEFSSEKKYQVREPVCLGGKKADPVKLSAQHQRGHATEDIL